MAETGALHLWGMRALYVTLAFLAFFAYLLPLELTPSRFSGPDILVALSFAWVLRRPGYVPPWLIAGVMLLADFLFMRPPGLWAALVLLACTWLRRQAPRLRENTFAAEWLNVTVALVAITLLYRLMLALFLIPAGSLLMVISQCVLTLAIYPLVVALGHLALGVRHSTPGEFDRGGGRL